MVGNYFLQARPAAATFLPLAAFGPFLLAAAFFVFLTAFDFEGDFVLALLVLAGLIGLAVFDADFFLGFVALGLAFNLGVDFDVLLPFVTLFLVEAGFGVPGRFVLGLFNS